MADYEYRKRIKSGEPALPREEIPEPADPEARRFHGLPLVTADGAHLGLRNAKSRTIHIMTETGDQHYANAVNQQSTSACGAYSVNTIGLAHRQPTVLYLTLDELTDGHLIRDGAVLGKVCGHCQRFVDAETGGES